MKTTSLSIDEASWNRLLVHLLPQNDPREQAAFIFANDVDREDHTVLEAVELDLMKSSDFSAQYADYLDLSDEARQRVIRKAHQLDACLVEIHSHRRCLSPVSFSPSDRRGLLETVPHMAWRLKGRPYLAIVVARGDFDALLFRGSVDPAPLDRIDLGSEKLRPTNVSLSRWDRHEHWSI